VQKVEEIMAILLVTYQSLAWGPPWRFPRLEGNRPPRPSAD